MMLNFFKNKSVWIGLFIISYFVLVIPQVQKLFVGDEIAFVKAAHGIVTTGMPIYEGLSNNIKIGLWHPTLYINILAASFKFLGVHEWSARIVSVLFTLSTLVIVYSLAKEISNDNRYVIFLSCFLFLFNPLVIQNSLFIDIDNSVLAFLMILFIYAYIKIDRTKPKNLFVLGILFGVTLWAKLPTPPFLILGILMFNFYKQEFKKGIVESIMIALPGTLLFLGSWLLYCHIFDLSYLQPFTHLANKLSSMPYSMPYILMTRLGTLKTIMFWTTPYYILLVLTSSINLIRTTSRNRMNIIYLSIIGYLIFMGYIIIDGITVDFPKYFAPVMPIFSIVVADFIGKFCNVKKRSVLYFTFLILILFIYYIFILKDPLLVKRLSYNNILLSVIVLASLKTFMFYLLPIAISFIFIIALKINYKQAFVLAMIIPLVTCSLYIGVVQSKADYSTTYRYGETGFKETINFANAKINKEDTIITRKDVAYYLNSEKCYDLPKSPATLKSLIDRKNISYIILRKHSYYVPWKYTEVLSILDSECKLEAQFGDYKIYVPNDEHLR